MNENLKLVEEENEIENPELDYYYWDGYKEDYFVKVFRKVINRNEGNKKVWCEYWNGDKYVSAKAFEKHNLKIPEKPVFYIPDYEDFKKNKVIFIVEGEKDVENLRDLGFTATTLASGSNTIPENKLEELDIFKKKTVLLIGDNDVPGRDYIDDLAYKLYLSEYPQEIRKADIRDLWEKVPDKGDISDWIKDKNDSGNSKEETINELKKFFDEQSIYTPPLDNNFEYFTAEDLLKMDIPPLTWLVSDLIPDQGLIQLAGAPKSGKSIFALQLANSIIKEDSTFLGQEVKHGSVVYIDFENAKRIMKERTKKNSSLGTNGIKNLHFIRSHENSVIKSLNDGFIDQIDSYLKKLNYDVVLVIIDMFKYIQSGSSKNANLHDTKEINKLTKYSQEHNIPFLLLNHTTKESNLDTGSVFEKSMGTQSVFGSMDTQLILKKVKNEDQTVKCHELYITGREIEDQSYILNMVKGEFLSGGTLSEYLFKIEKNKILKSEIGYEIATLLDFMDEGDKWKGTSHDFINKMNEYNHSLEDSKSKAREITTYIKNNKVKLEQYLNCSIEMVGANGKSSKTNKYIIKKLTTEQK